jgi:hypothetical protein
MPSTTRHPGYVPGSTNPLESGWTVEGLACCTVDAGTRLGDEEGYSPNSMAACAPLAAVFAHPAKPESRRLLGKSKIGQAPTCALSCGPYTRGVRNSLLAICLIGVAYSVSACEVRTGNASDGEVVYDVPRALMGKAQFGRDEVIILLCDERRTCGDSLSFGQLALRSCALEPTKAVTDALLTSHGIDAASSAGEFWIEGVGRRSKGGGHFGHVGGFQCRVRFDDVASIDAGPPYIWTPPIN